jgi:hypothetical protein
MSSTHSELLKQINELKLLVYRLSMDVRARVWRALQVRRTVGKERLTHHH